MGDQRRIFSSEFQSTVNSLTHVSLTTEVVRFRCRSARSPNKSPAERRYFLLRSLALSTDRRPPTR